MSIMDEFLGVGGVGWIYHILFLPGSGISSFQSISLLLSPPFPCSVPSKPGRERGHTIVVSLPIISSSIALRPTPSARPGRDVHTLIKR